MSKPAYRGRWPRQARLTITAAPRCEWCGATDDLCADHLVPGRPDLGTRTLCRPCNSARARGATGPTRIMQRDASSCSQGGGGRDGRR